MTRRELFTILTALVLSPVLKALEFSVFPAVNRPDFLTVLAVTIGLSCNGWVALPGGFLIGLLEDLTILRAPGARAVSLAVAAATASSLRRFLSPESLPSRVLIALLGNLAGDLTCYGLLRLMDIRIGFQYFGTVLGFSLVWSAAALLPVGFVVKRVVNLIFALFPDDSDQDRRAWA